MSKPEKDRTSTHKGKHSSSASLQAALAQAEVMLEKGQVQEAISLLEPLAERHSRAANLHTMLASAHVQAEELWKAAEQYEKALSLKRDASLLVSLGFIFLELDLNVLALETFRRALKSDFREPLVAELLESVQQLEYEIMEIVDSLGLPRKKVLKGSRFLEEAQIAFENEDFARSVHLNRKAARLLRDFPPPHNNLSLALFFHGRPDDAIRTARQVVARHPDNIQALSNLLRFLTWTGKTEEARQVWEQLKPLSPHDPITRMKKVEAAALMEADEDVYQLLQERDEEREQKFYRRKQLFLAVAEANTGRRTAERRLKELQKTNPWAKQILEALRAGKSGLGWAERFPYFHAGELLPKREIQAFIELVDQQEKMSAVKFWYKVDRYAARFPQLVLLGKKTLLEEQKSKAAIALLTTLGTPEAYDVLREFGLGKIGDEQTRLQALFALLEEDQIPENEPLQFWKDGEWEDIVLRKAKIAERELDYTHQVVDLIQEALLAFKEGRLTEAEKLYRRVLELEPRAKEAYNNLATVYSRQEKYAEARAMYLKAIELDPLYIMPRCNLALFLLHDDNVEEAVEMLAPLDNIPELQPQELAFLWYVHAQIQIAYDDYDQARNMLETALKVVPDYEPAQTLLEQLEFSGRMTQTAELLSKVWERSMEEQRQRNLARRERMRSQLKTPDPTLAQALGIYTKAALGDIARRIIPWGGWSALRKAELHQHLVDHLLDEDSLARVLESLTPEDRKAFDHVRTRGGSLAWDLFDQDFDNDLDQTPFWIYRQLGTVMGRLRAHGLLVEATVGGKLMVSIPVELRK